MVILGEIARSFFSLAESLGLKFGPLPFLFRCWNSFWYEKSLCVRSGSVFRFQVIKFATSKAKRPFWEMWNRSDAGKKEQSCSVSGQSQVQCVRHRLGMTSSVWRLGVKHGLTGAESNAALSGRNVTKPRRSFMTFAVKQQRTCTSLLSFQKSSRKYLTNEMGQKWTVRQIYGGWICVFKRR